MGMDDVEGKCTDDEDKHADSCGMLRDGNDPQMIRPLKTKHRVHKRTCTRTFPQQPKQKCLQVYDIQQVSSTQ